MKKLLTLAIASLALCVSSCSDEKKPGMSEERQEMEAQGQICLKAAREALNNDNFVAARENIEKMRSDFPLALNAREEGILLMDSINLMEAEAQIKAIDKIIKEGQNPKIDSLKIEFDDLFQKTKFYKRKLEHDKANTKTH